MYAVKVTPRQVTRLAPRRAQVEASQIGIPVGKPREWPEVIVMPGRRSGRIITLHRVRGAFFRPSENPPFALYRNGGLDLDLAVFDS